VIDVKALAESKTLPSGTNLSKLFGINVVGTPVTPKLPPGGLKTLQKQVTAQQQQQQQGLSYLQKQAKHKGPIPSNKPLWKTALNIGRKALSPHGIVGKGAVVGATAIDPGLGLLVGATQKIFGGNVEKSHVLRTLVGLLETEKPPSPHGSEFEHIGRADLKAQGFKPKGRGAGNSSHEAALVAWKHAQNSGKQATAVIGGRGWGVLRPGDKVAHGQPHMTVTPEGVLHAYEPKKITSEARYLHRIPKVAKDPTDTNLDFTWGSDGMKKRRKKPMDKLINPNGQWIRS
jgi:hypothetical protein